MLSLWYTCKIVLKRMRRELNLSKKHFFTRGELKGNGQRGVEKYSVVRGYMRKMETKKKRGRMSPSLELAI